MRNAYPVYAIHATEIPHLPEMPLDKHYVLRIYEKYFCLTLNIGLNIDLLS